MTEEKKPKEQEKVETKKETPKKEEPKKQPEKKLEDKQEHFAIAKAINVAISTKQSVEISNFIRKKHIQKAKMLLQEVLDRKKAIPFKRYNRDMGHKPGKIAAGRYPEKSVNEFLRLLNTVQANAENKGLDTKILIIEEIKADKGPQQWHYGRLRRRKMKNTNLFVKVMEKEE
jgi:large subunit ribosomal protein L22